MRTINIIVAIIIAAFTLPGCTTKSNFDYRVTVVPQTNSLSSKSELNRASEVISKRVVNFFSIPQERIKLDITENQISLTITAIDTGKIREIKKVITAYDKLEFWETYENNEVMGYLISANNLLRDMHHIADLPGTTNAVQTDSLAEFTRQNPLFGVLRPRVTGKGEPLPSCMIGLTVGKDTSLVNSYFKSDQVKEIFPPDIKFYWSAFPYEYDKTKTLFELHAIKVTSPGRKAPLDGSEIITAKLVKSSGNQNVKIDLTMDKNGASDWASITRRNINRCIAVVYNGYVRSYPRVMSEISGGNTEITGDFTTEEATTLVNILRSGGLPFQLKITNEQIVKGV